MFPVCGGGAENNLCPLCLESGSASRLSPHMSSEQAVVWGTGRSAQGPPWKVCLLMLASGVLRARHGEKGRRGREEAGFVQEKRSESGGGEDLREEGVWPVPPTRVSGVPSPFSVDRRGSIPCGLSLWRSSWA